MRVLIATGLFPPQAGGPATYSKLLLDKLPAYGFEVEVCIFSSVLKYPKVLRHLVYTGKLIWHGYKTDIIYAQDPMSVGLPAVIASKILQKKFCLKIVGDYAWEQGTQRFGVKDLLDQFSTEYTGYTWKVRLLKIIEKFVADHADKIVVPSNYLKKIVRNWGVDPDKITVIYNSFDAPERANANTLQKIDGSIISAGRLVPWKGFNTLIRMMPSIMREVPNAHLYICGDGPDRSSLDGLIKDLGMDKSVTLLGQLDQSALFGKIGQSEVFVLNTSYEGLSHQLLEVMAIGTPIITTAVGGNMEVIEDGKTGVLVQFDDQTALKRSIIECLKNKENCSMMAANAKKKLEMFSEEKMLRSLSQLLKSQI